MSTSPPFPRELLIAAQAGRPTTRLLGILDVLAHKIHLPEVALAPLCDWYDRRLIGDAP